MFHAFVIQHLWVCTIALLQECAARNVQHRLLQQYMCGGGLCVSCLHNSESVGVYSSLAGRNVQRRLLHHYMCVGAVFPALVIHNLWVCTDIYNVYSSLAARMCSKKCAAQAASAVYV